MAILKRYKAFLIFLFILFIIYFYKKEIGLKAIDISLFSLKEMLIIIPPIFILLGLLDVWVPKETMMKYLGEGSGIKGTLLAFFIGSAAAGPLYGAFPIAGLLLKKGAKLSNVFIFIGAWSTTKIPMFLFEIASMGIKFAVIRMFLNIPVIILISIILSKNLAKHEKEEIYARAKLIK